MTSPESCLHRDTCIEINEDQWIQIPGHPETGKLVDNPVAKYRCLDCNKIVGDAVRRLPKAAR